MPQQINSNHSQHKERDILVARQPIFGLHKNVFAYELLFGKGFHNYVSRVDAEYSNIKVISDSLVIGLNKLTGGKRAFIKFSHKLLLGKVPWLFPMDLLAVEILEQTEPVEKIIAVCEKMKTAGYLLVLDDFTFDEKYRLLIQLVDIYKVDFLARSPEYRRSIFAQVDSQKIKFLAKKIETQAQFEEAKDLGYTYFQGFFFQKPYVLSSREMPGFKLNYLEILRKISNPQLPFDDIEKILKRDVSLTYKLLRFINSASYGFRVTIRSIRHALTLLGKREVKKWLTIIALSGIGTDKPRELMDSILVRSRFCELIGLELKLKQQTADLFLMGMFSMAAAFLDRPMEEILEDLPLDETIKSALLGEEGLFKDALNLVIAYERADWSNAARLSKYFKITEGKLVDLYVESLLWAQAF